MYGAPEALCGQGCPRSIRDRVLPQMDRFIETTPFFSSEHRSLANRVAEFAEREIEVRAGDDEGDADEALRGYVMLLAENGFLRYAVPEVGQAFDLRAFCIIRENLSYS